MSRTSLKRPAAVVPEPAVATAPLPSRDEFKADCQALTSAVMRTLGADLGIAAKNPAAKDPFSLAVPPGQVAGIRGDAGSEPVHYPGAIAFVPPFNFIMQAVRTATTGRGPSDDIVVSRRLLEFLLRCILAHIDFDEQQYQASNPDVAAAIKQRKMPSGREHFIKTGYFEGRAGGVHVDEAWYLARNPDVAAAKRAGRFGSGADQYRLAGASECRVPNPQSEDAIRIWKSVLER